MGIMTIIKTVIIIVHGFDFALNQHVMLLLLSSYNFETMSFSYFDPSSTKLDYALRA